MPAAITKQEPAAQNFNAQLASSSEFVLSRLLHAWAANANFLMCRPSDPRQGARTVTDLSESQRHLHPSGLPEDMEGSILLHVHVR